jgi:hypothetical protein
MNNIINYNDSCEFMFRKKMSFRARSNFLAGLSMLWLKPPLIKSVLDLISMSDLSFLILLRYTGKHKKFLAYFYVTGRLQFLIPYQSFKLFSNKLSAIIHKRTFSWDSYTKCLPNIDILGASSSLLKGGFG